MTFSFFFYWFKYTKKKKRSTKIHQAQKDQKKRHKTYYLPEVFGKTKGEGPFVGELLDDGIEKVGVNSEAAAEGWVPSAELEESDKVPLPAVNQFSPDFSFDGVVTKPFSVLSVFDSFSSSLSLLLLLSVTLSVKVADVSFFSKDFVKVPLSPLPDDGTCCSSDSLRVILDCSPSCFAVVLGVGKAKGLAGFSCVSVSMWKKGKRKPCTQLKSKFL